MEIESGKKFGFSVYSEVDCKIAEANIDPAEFLNKVYNVELAKKEGDNTTIGPGMKFYTGARAGSNE